MNDLELKTRLTADASGLSAALRQGAREQQDYSRTADEVSNATKRLTTAEREAQAALNTAAAARKAFMEQLRDQVKLQGKSAEDVLRYRAAQAGVAQEAAPLILQLQHQRAAHQAAAEAAREEAAAQREAAQAKKSAEAAQQAFLNGLREQVELQGKSGGEVLRYRAQQLGVGPEAEKYITQYEVAMKKAGVTAGQTAAAMRMLPAQVTDITTSLAAGMPLWMVLLQQGGQVKDSFGGLTPMFTALRAAISPLALAAGGLAAVLGTVAFAAYRGVEQTREMERVLIVSGNAAGTTTGRMTSMAQAIAKVTGSQTSAIETLTTLAATGAVADRNLEAFGLTAERMQKRLSVAVQQTAKDFEDLARNPVQKTVELNRQYGYLTTTVYEQIKALEKQGRVQEAGELAQRTYAAAMNSRTAELEKQLGSIERGWERVKKMASGAWDSMTAIGRPKTTQQELDLVSEQLNALDTRRSNNPTLTAQRREAIRQRQAELQEQLRFENRSAEAQARERAGVNKTVEDDKRDDAERSALQSAQIARIKDRLAAMTGAYADADRVVEQQHAASLIDERSYWEAKRELIAANEAAQVAALASENKVLEAQKVYGAEKIARDQQVASNQAEMARIRAKAATDTVIANAQEEAGYKRLALALYEYGKQLDESADARMRAHQRELATLGRGDEARGLAGRLNGVDDRYLQARSQLESDRLASRMTQTEYQQRLAMLDAYHASALEAETRYQEELVRAQEDGSLGMQRALENYADKARNVASMTEEMFSRAFSSMEDAIVRFAMTGKLNFRSLAESIIADLIRIQVRQQLVSIFSSVFGVPSGAGGAGSGVDWSTVGPEVMHGGGVVGTDSFARRADSAAAWRAAPRFHTGLKSDEYRAILQRGESVLTPAQMRQLAPVGAAVSPTVNVSMPLNLINNSGTPLKATPQQRGDGGWDVILEAVESSMAANVSNGVGPVARAIEGRYGLQASMNT